MAGPIEVKVSARDVPEVAAELARLRDALQLCARVLERCERVDHRGDLVCPVCEADFLRPDDHHFADCELARALIVARGVLR